MPSTLAPGSNRAVSDESGMAFRVRHVAGPPVVSIRLWLRGGQRIESHPGLAWACGRMLTEGTTRRRWEVIAEEAEAHGASIQGFGGFEVQGLALDGLSTDWRQLLRWAEELVGQSVFPGDRLAWTVRQGQGELVALQDPPDSATYLAFLDQLYAPHPRSRPPQGTREALERLEADDLLRFHQLGVQRGLLLSVAGRVDEDEVTQWIEERLGRSTPRPGPRSDGVPWEAPVGVPGAARPSARQVVEVDGQGQAHLFLGHLTVPRWHPEEAALEIASVILGAGAGLSGRIPQRVREQEGLAYTVSASLVQDAGSDSGRATFYAATSSETVADAERVIREEWQRALEDGFTESEVEEARTYLLGREAFRRETARQWANRLAESLFWGRPCDQASWCVERLQKVTQQQVETALRSYLRPAEMKVTVGR